MYPSLEQGTDYLHVPDDIWVCVLESIGEIQTFLSLEMTCRRIRGLIQDNSHLIFVKECLAYDRHEIPLIHSPRDALYSLRRHEQAWRNFALGAIRTSEPELDKTYPSNDFWYQTHRCAGGYLYFMINSNTLRTLSIHRIDLSTGEIKMSWLQQSYRDHYPDTTRALSDLLVDASQNLLVIIHRAHEINLQNIVVITCYALSTGDPYQNMSVPQEQVMTLPHSHLSVSLCATNLCFTHQICEKDRYPGAGLFVVDWQQGTLKPSKINPVTRYPRTQSHFRPGFLSPDVIHLMRRDPPCLELVFLPSSADETPTVLTFSFPALRAGFRFFGALMRPLTESQVFPTYDSEPRMLNDSVLVFDVATDPREPYLLVVHRDELLQYAESDINIHRHVRWGCRTAEITAIPFEDWSRHVSTTFISLGSDRFSRFGIVGHRLLVHGWKDGLPVLKLFDFGAYSGPAPSGFKNDPDVRSPSRAKHRTLITTDLLDPDNDSKSGTGPSDAFIPVEGRKIMPYSQSQIALSAFKGRPDIYFEFDERHLISIHHDRYTRELRVRTLDLYGNSDNL